MLAFSLAAAPLAFAGELGGKEGAAYPADPGGKAARTVGFTPAAATLGVVGTYAVPVPGSASGDVVNYVLVSTDSDHSGITFALNGTAVVPTAVLTSSGSATLIKLEVPAGESGILRLTSTGAATDLDQYITVAAPGTAAPHTLFGETDMGFAAFNHDVTAGIAEVAPALTSFETGAAIAAPLSFITDGTRATWPTNDSKPKVDAISSATYGDSVHFIPPGGLVLNYDDPTTKADDHRVTAVKGVEVGVVFDLIANASLLDAASLATSQSGNIMAIASGITWKAEADVYKAKYLFADGSFGARETSEHNAGVAKAWPAQTTVLALSGNTWTAREAQVNFDMTGTNGTDFWNNYLNYLYGGYVENKATGARQPLVFLQNIFTHRGHTNIDVSLNDQIFQRFASLGFPGDYKIVLYAYGCEDVVFESHLASYVNGSAVIEQGATFNIKANDQSTWFEGKQLHIQGLAPGYDPSQASLVKGTAAVPSSQYVVEIDNGEVAVTFADAYFQGAFQGSYTLRLATDTADVVSKPLTFTVNQWVDRPTLQAQGANLAGQAGETEASPALFSIDDDIDFSNAELAKGFVTAGRTVSSISDLTDTAATVALADVLTRAAATDPYHLDLSSLVIGHVYRLNLITTNYAVGTSAQSAQTTLTYYVQVQAPAPPSSVTYLVTRHFGEWSGTGTASGTVDADAAKFVLLTKDGQPVDAAAYSVVSGSTVITLTEAYLKTLAAGSHSYIAVFSDGSSQPITLTVSSAGAGGSGSGEGVLALAGDNMPLLVVGALVVLAMAGLAFAAAPRILRRRRAGNKKA
jgi:hypothetical protein